MRHFTAAITFIFIFSSCRDNSENSLVVYRTAEEGLQQSNKNISLATNVLYHEFEEKLNEPETKEKADIWLPKARVIKKLSDSMVKCINGLKEELKNEAGGNDPKNKSWENSLGVSEHLFESHGKGRELLEALIKYKEAVLAVDPRMSNQFEHSINVFSDEFIFSATDTISFTKTFFRNIPVIAANVVLSKFVNDLNICESELIRFCYNQIGSVDGPGMFRKFSVIAGQSSNYLKAGDELEIVAGIGAFSDASMPRISINNKLIPLNEDAVSIYKLKVPLKAGKYTVPVKIEYIKPDGVKDFLTKKIEYTVVE